MIFHELVVAILSSKNHTKKCDSDYFEGYTIGFVKMGGTFHVLVPFYNIYY